MSSIAPTPYLPYDAVDPASTFAGSIVSTSATPQVTASLRTPSGYYCILDLFTVLLTSDATAGNRSVFIQYFPGRNSPSFSIQSASNQGPSLAFIYNFATDASPLSSTQYEQNFLPKIMLPPTSSFSIGVNNVGAADFYSASTGLRLFFRFFDSPQVNARAVASRVVPVTATPVIL